MKPIQQLAHAKTPDGEALTLCRKGDEFSIQVNRQELMTSRAHESECELARLGCARILQQPKPVVLVGGLGMGYTLRAALDLLGPKASVVVSELMPEMVAWNREHLGGLTGHPLRDPRVDLRIGDVVEIIRNSECVFDAILLDVDNGPEAFTSSGNDQLYSRQGVQMCMRALQPKGCLAIWAGSADSGFEKRVRQENLPFRCCPTSAYKGARTLSRYIWLIARDMRALPPSRASV